jgi:hypothetical protein
MAGFSGWRRGAWIQGKVLAREYVFRGGAAPDMPRPRVPWLRRQPQARILGRSTSQTSNVHLDSGTQVILRVQK